MKSQNNANKAPKIQPLSGTTVNDFIKILSSGNIATIPTETVEGYAVALSSRQGIQDLMKLKDRNYNSGKVFTLVPESKDTIDKYVLIPDQAKLLIDRYIPGELTLILPKNPSFKHFYYDHYDTIGIRIPAHPLFPELLKAIGPIILTSANPRGGTPKSTTGHQPSTIIDFTNPQSPQLLRQGNLNIAL